jgi:hypothetical protein
MISLHTLLLGLFFDVTRLIIGVTQGPCELKDLRAGDTIVVGVVLEESDSNEQSGGSND